MVVEAWSPPDVSEGMALLVGLMGADGLASLKCSLGHDQPAKQLAGLLQLASLPGFVRPPMRATLHLLGQHCLANTMRDLHALTAGQLWQLVALDAGRYDAIICPPCPVPALLYGSSSSLGLFSYAALYNLLGMPAGVVPATRVRLGEESDRPQSKDGVEKAAKQVEMNSAGLPVGVQVVARNFREDVALAVMSALEDHFRQQPDYPTRPEI